MKSVSTNPNMAFPDAEKTTLADIVGIKKNVIDVSHYTYVKDTLEEIAIYRIVFDDNTYISTSANAIVAPIVSYLSTEAEPYPFTITVGTRTSRNGRTYYYLQ